MNIRTRCRVCQAEAGYVGGKLGAFRKTRYLLYHCSMCGFSFVSNCDVDHENIYNEQYYAGRGADPKVDYLFELAHPTRTVRQYEWRGILKVIPRW